MANRGLAAAIVLAAGCTLVGAAARADGLEGAPPAVASAFGVASTFVSGGTATSLAPLPVANGLGGHWHHDWANRGMLTETLYIGSVGLPIATLQVSAQKMKVHSAAPNEGEDRHFASSADGSIGSLTLTLQAYPAEVAGTPPLLSIVADGVSFQSSESVTRPNPPVMSASTSITSLVVTGSLLNGDTFNGSGNGLANDVITIPMGTGYVRLTINGQTTSGNIVCKSSCVFTPTGIVADALLVHLDTVTVGASQMTGDITVGEAAAQVGIGGGDNPYNGN